MELSWLSSSADILGHGEQEVGGKALGLARLATMEGVRVPAFLVVPASVLDGQALPPSPTAAVLAPLSEALLRDHLNALRHELGPGPYAVRSSMVGEDSKTHSFAGQLHTDLEVELADLPTAFARCWASAFAGGVAQYRERAGLTGPPRMAVVVQAMARGTVSGVAFSADPTTGRRDRILVSACWGLGEGVVDGSCNADEFVWNAAIEREESARVAHKDTAVMSTDGGTALVPVDASQRDVRCLSPEELNAVAVLTKRVAEHMGSPQDVEWTLMDGHPILLQSRPITRLPMEPEPEVPARVFDNSNIQESYCGLTYPLTFSFASRAYHRVYAQTMAAVGLSAATIAADEKRLRGLLALVDGRVYYDIDNWYRGLLLLPSFGRNKADMEAMMGLTEPVDLVQDHVLSVGQKLAALPRLLLTGARLVAAIRGLPKSVPAWLARFDGRERSFREAPLAGLAFHRAMATLAQLDDQMLGDWHIPIVNDFAVMMHVGKLRRALERAVGDSADALLPRLLAGEQGIESTAPTHALMAMARTIDSRPALRDTVLHGTTEAAYAALTADPSLGPAVADYVARYGDRVVGELKLETKTLRHDPSFLIQVLRSYSGQPHLDPELLGAKERQTRSDAERELRDAVGAWRFRALHRQLRAARRAIKDRESMRLRRTRAFGLVRDVYRGIGKTLAQSGLLDDAEQVFFLTVEELRDFHDGRAVTADLAGLARMREAQYRSYEAGGEPPHRVIADGSPYLSRRAPAVANHDASSELSGIGCYPGVVEAAAQVVHEPTECASLDGKILVTTRTDPGWAPLFPSCGGIAVERGSTLSHSAVVARELGIPAVVGVPGLVAQIEQGEALRLDGARGTIIRLSQDSSAPQ